MSHPTQPVSSSSITQDHFNTQALPNLSFLETAGKMTKIIVGVFAGIAAIGSLGIGITMSPFSAEIGGAALTIAATLFGVASYLIYNATSSSTPDLSPRAIGAL